MHWRFSDFIYPLQWTALAVLCLTACAPEVSEPPNPLWNKGVYIPASEQTPGDPFKGEQYITTKAYVSCGIPFNAFGALRFLTPVTRDEPLPGRGGPESWLPYNWNYYVTPDNVEMAVPNCLGCHASHFNGKLVIGLGDTEGDYTVDYGMVSGMAEFMKITEGYILTERETDELEKFVSRTKTLSGFTKMRTVGSNPADAIGTQLFRRRDRHTLAWSDEPLLPLPDYPPVPLDVPPWWRMRKKNAQFYNGMGRGELKRLMMSASSLCVDTNEDARAIDAYFNDVRAYIASLRPPTYPFAIDSDKADLGEDVFAANCAGCHGSYGENESYPNLLFPSSVIGTDNVYASAHTLATDYVEWYNESFWGEIAYLEPYDGYVAPPLDGIWATAPFLHNGSVPTLAALLDSSTRPTYWRRRSYDSRQFDQDALGWPYDTLDYGQDVASDDERKFIYDTTQFGHGKGGHTFGDHLTARERRALIEYLKTL